MKQIAILALSGVALATIASTASARDAHVKSMSYNTQAIYEFDVINVYSSDGQQWDTIDGPPIKFSADMAVDTRWPGDVHDFGVLLGICADAGCYGYPLIGGETLYSNDMNLNRVYEIAMADIPTSSDAGVAIIPLGDEILSACNAHLSANGATELYTFNGQVWTSFSVDTSWGVHGHVGSTGGPVVYPYDRGDVTAHDSFTVQVRCNPYIEEYEVVPPYPPVNDIELFLATFSNAHTQPDAFRECQQGRIKVRVTTEYAGPVGLRLWTTTGAGLQDEYILTWSAEIGSGAYEAEVERWVSVAESSTLQAMAQVENGGVAGMSSGWKLLPLECVTGTNQLTGNAPPDVIPSRGGDGGLVSN